MSSRRAGRAVPVSGSAATDRSLTPGTLYSYALFTRLRGRWVGPVTLRAATASAPGQREKVSFALDPSTLVGGAGDVAGISVSGGVVRVTLKRGVVPPVLGAAVLLGKSAALPGGYVGKVKAISSDGRVLTLVPATLSDAFAYYSIDVPQIGSGGSSSSALARLAHASAPMLTIEHNGCSWLSGDGGGAFEPPSLSWGGHYIASYSHSKILGINVPSGASFDVALTATASTSLAFDIDAERSCEIEFEPYTQEVGDILGVPIGLVFEPVAELSASAAGSISGVELNATAGFYFRGSVNGPTKVPFTGGLISSGGVATPSGTLSGTLGVSLGGRLTVGPGVVSKEAGAIAGIEGEFLPLDASLTTISDSNSDQPCWVVDEKVSDKLNVTEQVWLGDWATDETFTPSWGDLTIPVSGFPADQPAGCDDLKITTASLPDATQGQQYGPQSLQATGGTTPYTWSVSSGALPDGLTLDPETGVIDGTPTGSGTSQFTITITDHSDPAKTTSKDLSITVASGGPQVTSTTLDAAWINTPYDETLQVTGGTPPYTWAITGGTLPSWLTLDTSTGEITGTEPTSDSCIFCSGGATTNVVDQLTVEVTDANGLTADSTIPLGIMGTPPPCTSGCSLVAEASGTPTQAVAGTLVTSPAYVPTSCWTPSSPPYTYPDGDPTSYLDACTIATLVLSSDGAQDAVVYGDADVDGGEVSAADGQDPSTLDVPFAEFGADCGGLEDYYSPNGCAGDEVWMELWSTPNNNGVGWTLLDISNAFTWPSS